MNVLLHAVTSLSSTALETVLDLVSGTSVGETLNHSNLEQPRRMVFSALQDV